MIEARQFAIGLGLALCLIGAVRADERPQYEFGDIRIPRASADEPIRDAVSLALSVEYIEQAPRAWNGTRKCVTCHTNGVYMTIRPRLAGRLGPPDEAMRTFFVEALDQQAVTDPETLQKGTRPAAVVYTAAGLAEWDAYVTGKLSAETERALHLMLELQRDSGTWGAVDCWPPYESDAYHLATVAAMAVGVAPGWFDKQTDPETLAAVNRLKTYLTSETPPHDYGRLLLLWASSRMPDLIDARQKNEVIAMVSNHQRPDGGWSIRTFSAPEAWGRGNRAARLRNEPDFEDPPSDGHQTGLAIIVLRDVGVAADDPRIRKGVEWLLENQRVSGRWWTRSLNTDAWHFITYSGTLFPVLALSLCDALPAEE